MPADVVVTNARIYTAGPQRDMAEALGLKDGKIAFVGSAADAKAWVGPHTQVVRLNGKLVLPGLFDSHVHPIEIIDADVCNLDSRPQKTLSDMSAFVRACALKYKLPASPATLSFSIRIFSTSRTRVGRMIFETPMCSRLGSWANGFTSATFANRLRREV